MESGEELPEEDVFEWIYRDLGNVRPAWVDPNVRRIVSEFAMICFLYLAQENRLASLFRDFCDGPWARELARPTNTPTFLELFDDPVDDVARGALRIWSESDYDEALPDVVELVLGRSGALRTTAVEALDRWFARQ